MAEDQEAARKKMVVEEEQQVPVHLTGTFLELACPGGNLPDEQILDAVAPAEAH